METGEDNVAKEPKEQRPNNVAVLVLWTIVLIGAMIASLMIVGPSGQKLGFLDFVLFWLREIIALLLGLILILVIVIDKLLHRIQARKKSAKPPVPAESNGRAWE